MPRGFQELAFSERCRKRVSKSGRRPLLMRDGPGCRRTADEWCSLGIRKTGRDSDYACSIQNRHSPYLEPRTRCLPSGRRIADPSRSTQTTRSSESIWTATWFRRSAAALTTHRAEVRGGETARCWFPCLNMVSSRFSAFPPLEERRCRSGGLGPPDTAQTWPAFLPDGRFLYFLNASSPDVKGVYVGSVGSGMVRRLFDADSGAVYASGHVMFVRQGTLMARIRRRASGTRAVCVCHRKTGCRGFRLGVGLERVELPGGKRRHRAASTNLV